MAACEALPIVPLFDEEPVVLLHALPGRVRLHYPRLTEVGSSQVEARLSRLPGVTSARANLMTRNVLVEYDHRRLTIDALIEALPARGRRAPVALSAHKTSGTERGSLPVATRTAPPSSDRSLLTPETLALLLKGASLALSISSALGNPLALAATGIEAIQLVAEARTQLTTPSIASAPAICSVCGSHL